jgi:CRP-like cAMP-binding protein
VGTNVKLLRGHPLLARLTEEQLIRVAASGEIEHFQPGEDIVVAGSLGEAFYLILSGAAQVFAAADGRGRSLATLDAGEFFGEMSLIEPAPRSATVSAAEQTFLFRLPSVALQTLLQDDARAFNAVLVQIVKTLSERLRRANDMITSVGHLADWLAGSLV